MAPSMRALPNPLYGMTADDVANLSDVVTSSNALSQVPITRVCFDVRRPAS